MLHFWLFEIACVCHMIIMQVLIVWWNNSWSKKRKLACVFGMSGLPRWANVRCPWMYVLVRLGSHVRWIVAYVTGNRYCWHCGCYTTHSVLHLCGRCWQTINFLLLVNHAIKCKNYFRYPDNMRMVNLVERSNYISNPITFISSQLMQRNSWRSSQVMGVGSFGCKVIMPQTYHIGHEARNES